MSKYALPKSFVEMYAKMKAPFGYNGLGEFTYRRTFARLLENGRHEEWYQTIERVVNGTYSMQKDWIESRGLGWDNLKPEAKEMYDRMFEMKFLPPGRGLWAMGTDITEKRKLYAALNNCAFVSTEDMHKDPIRPFTFLMDASMLGVGTGYDTKGAGTVVVKGPTVTQGMITWWIEDSREGWVSALEALLQSYFNGERMPMFRYDRIRPAGLPLKVFGGVSSGAQPLQDLLTSISSVLFPLIEKRITVTAIVDIMNLIGKCVIAGNVRRTAEIAFGDPNCHEFLDLKDYSKNPSRAAHGWTSNNSVFAELGMDYTEVCKRVQDNGEPGFAWLSNMRQYNRMSGREKDSEWKDCRVSGGNPCLEQSLESFELCCLVEVFPDKHKDLYDFLRTLKFAYLYAKTVTLGETHWPETNRVLLRNRRIGCSLSGLTQFIAHRGLGTLKLWCEIGYEELERLDKVYSDWLAIPRSIKMTSIKPSGTVSLLAGATPGMHFPESRYYIRRVRVATNSHLMDGLVKRGYHIEPVHDDPMTSVVSIPIDVGPDVRTLADVSMWEQLELAAFLQEYWADNQVSCTVTFTKEEGSQIKHALDFYQYRLKGVSFLPKLQPGTYKQMPYETITAEQYHQMQADLQVESEVQPLSNLKLEESEREVERFCDGDTCTHPTEGQLRISHAQFIAAVFNPAIERMD